MKTTTNTVRKLTKKGTKEENEKGWGKDKKDGKYDKENKYSKKQREKIKGIKDKDDKTPRNYLLFLYTSEMT
jgi:hypothetical protein